MLRVQATNSWFRGPRGGVALGLAILLPLAASCGAQAKRDSTRTASEAPASHVLTIEQQSLAPYMPVVRDGSCYSDAFGSPNAVAVKDGTGAVIASSAFSDAGKLLSLDGLMVCLWRVEVTVPELPSYAVEVAATPQGWANPNLHDVFGEPYRCGDLLRGDCFPGYVSSTLSLGDLTNNYDWTIKLCASFCQDLTNAEPAPLGIPTVEAPSGQCFQESDECKSIAVMIRIVDPAMTMSGDNCASNAAGSINVLTITSDQTGDDVLATGTFPDTGRRVSGTSFCDITMDILLAEKDHVFYTFSVNPTPPGWTNPDVGRGGCSQNDSVSCFHGWNSDYTTESFFFFSRGMSPDGRTWIWMCDGANMRFNDDSLDCAVL